MPIELECREDICVLRLSGRLVAGTSPQYLEEKMSEIKSASCNKVLTDLRELVSIGSVGIGFLAGIYASVTKNPDGRFVLVGPQRRVREVLDLTRLTSIIPLVTDIASGMAVLRGEKTAESTAS